MDKEKNVVENEFEADEPKTAEFPEEYTTPTLHVHGKLKNTANQYTTLTYYY